jgi:hypothetical protein
MGDLRYEVAGSADPRMVLAGSGVVLRLLGGADGLDCGFALPLLLSDGILPRAQLDARPQVDRNRDEGWKGPTRQAGKLSVSDIVFKWPLYC